jgi:hypothetical protein
MKFVLSLFVSKVLIYSIKVYISIVEEFNCYELTAFHIYLGMTNDELSEIYLQFCWEQNQVIKLSNYFLVNH